MTRDMMNVIEQILQDGHLNAETLAMLRAAYYYALVEPSAEPVAIDRSVFPITGQEPQGCPTPGACSCPPAPNAEPVGVTIQERIARLEQDPKRKAALDRARERLFVVCVCGDRYPKGTYGAAWIDATGRCENCDACGGPAVEPAPGADSAPFWNDWPGVIKQTHELLPKGSREAMRMALDALVIAEAGLADIGDADREPGDDVAWCEARAARALPETRSAIRALRAALGEEK